MFAIFTFCLLLAAVAPAQAQPAQTSTAPAAKATTSTPQPGAQATSSSAGTATASAASPEAAAVPATEPVITIHGFCPGTASTAAKTKKASSPASARSCTTVITKAQLDSLIGALNMQNQPITPQVRRQFAQSYVDLLAFGEAAKKAGVDDAQFAQLMRFVRLNTLVRVYRAHLEEQYRKPPEKDIEDYYKQNTPKYEEITLARIFIPAKNPSAQSKDEWEKKAAQVANDIHDRAGKGEDLDKLQKEAYTTLGLTISPPNTSMGTRRRGMMQPQEEQELFALKPGEVSKLEQEPAGYIIYKLENKQLAPLDKVKDEISRELFRQKMEQKNKAIMGNIQADFNEKYFGPTTPPAPPASATRPGPAPTAPAQHPVSPAPAAAPAKPNASPAAPAATPKP